MLITACAIAWLIHYYTTASLTSCALYITHLMHHTKLSMGVNKHSNYNNKIS